jgi:site-specific recombinase XerD
MNEGTDLTLVPGGSGGVLPPVLASAGSRAGERTVEFFTAHIRNPNTREAYARAVSQFFAWMAERGLAEFQQLTPVHVAAWVESMVRDDFEPPTIKQRLAAVRMLFD